MFDQLFVRSGALTCELSAPLLDERRQYLTHCAVQGMTKFIEKLWISLDLGSPGNASKLSSRRSSVPRGHLAARPEPKAERLGWTEWTDNRRPGI
jgi:hypothetical protein